MTPPTRYLGFAEAGELLGLTPSAVKALHWKGLFIGPDIQIAKVNGWSRLRILEFGVMSGRLDADNNPVRLPGGTPPRVPRNKRPAHWDTPPEVFLSSHEASVLLGMKSNSFYFQRRRGVIDTPDPVVQVGDRPGWTRKAIRKFGRQTGRWNPVNDTAEELDT